ncbi:hypothetical protein F4778DRAFT_795832 [Xylariomycetidae sp. FL2044]|nr:hypothetical protein F4778DRAFT_795832 [Xylariomycetidae sp. FL2044]
MPRLTSESSRESAALDVPTPTPTAQEPKKLIVCFDGTGNTFSGSNADTNVVKLMNKLNRNDPHQLHYYQTGIGTYDINEKSVYKTRLGKLRSSISQTIDQGVGTTFDAHIMAGYRFLMRYYDSGDKIYMFGFSRGAFSAKFLARMINTIGLLCKGNEEMVPFAYRLYQRYLKGEFEEGTNRQFAHDEAQAFSHTFCRREKLAHSKVESNIKVYFLGIWDCVNSVAVLERESPRPVPVEGTAQFVRHAVAVDERRVKFKAALLAQDIRACCSEEEDMKEVWFPGCHGDVGGGWPAAQGHPLDNSESMTFWQQIRNFWTSRKATCPSADVEADLFQMSDVPLAWMIHELELVGQLDPAAAVKWCKSVHGFKRSFQLKKQQALHGYVHDPLRFGHGSGFFKVLFWKSLEWLPFITRWELKGNEWVNVRFPLNGGSARDIPPDAVLHASLLWRLREDPSYHPRNNHGDDLPPCLKHQGRVAEFEPLFQGAGSLVDPDHRTYRFAKRDVVAAAVEGGA